jgi:hypothetical protein
LAWARLAIAPAGRLGGVDEGGQGLGLAQGGQIGGLGGAQVQTAPRLGRLGRA